MKRWTCGASGSSVMNVWSATHLLKLQVIQTLTKELQRLVLGSYWTPTKLLSSIILCKRQKEVSGIELNKYYFCCLQVDLKFPTFISDGARDLISKLLRHNPTDRLSLQSVIDHPWVRSNSRRVLPPICQTEKS